MFGLHFISALIVISADILLCQQAGGLLILPIYQLSGTACARMVLMNLIKWVPLVNEENRRSVTV